MRTNLVKYGIIAALMIVLVACTASEVSAQLTSGGGSGGQGAFALEDDERNLKFAGVPIPNYSDVLGASLGVVAMAYYKLDRHDDDLPPSATGLFGFYSENNSWMGAAFQTIHYDEDKWRGTFALGVGDINYQFNPSAFDPGLPDLFVDYTTATNFFYLTGSRRTWKKLYLGLEVLTWTAEVSVEPAIIDVPEEHYTGPGGTAEWDARDNIMATTQGYLVSARYDIYDEAFGSDRNFQKLNLTISGYQSLGDSTKVLAGRIFNESAFGDVPFSGQSILSGNRNLRGYSDGRHRGNNLLTIEAEYRWNFWGRWGATAFTGVGFVSHELSTMALSEALPAVGFGLRYRMIEAYKINARLDVGWGKHDQGIYISIGEAF